MSQEIPVTLNSDSEIQEICKQIIAENRTEEEWGEIESDDMFQRGNYEGGFDATEKKFLFSYYDNEEKEWWFELSLDTARSISEGNITNFELYDPKD